MDVPEIISVRSIAESRLFRIEELDLMFSNGEQRTYERLAGGRRSAVIVVALNDQDELLLIKEYAAGFHEIQMSLVKGAADSGESLEDAANRELQEEIGFGDKSIQHLKCLTIAPGHMGFTIEVLLPKTFARAAGQVSRIVARLTNRRHIAGNTFPVENSVFF